jgi:heme-degrading monooxygenase HmoA
MYVMVRVLRARVGEEDAIIALHEDWRHTLYPGASGYVSGELLQDVTEPQVFIEITRYESEAAALVVASDPEYVAWQRRLDSLTVGEPSSAIFVSMWQCC